MYYQNEIREVAGYGNAERDVKLKPAEIKLAEQLVESLAADFKPQQFHDKFQDNLKALIEAKQEGRDVIEEQKPKPARVIDMMEALKRSLAQSESQKHTTDATREKKPARRTGTDHHRRKLAS